MTHLLRLELDSPALSAPLRFASFVRDVMRPIVCLNVEERRAGRLPPLYASGVRYRVERGPVERLRDGANVLRTGYGDCAQLAMWDVADDLAEGKRSNLIIEWDPTGNHFHVKKRRPDGREQDPTTILGG